MFGFLVRLAGRPDAVSCSFIWPSRKRSRFFPFFLPHVPAHASTTVSFEYALHWATDAEKGASLVLGMWRLSVPKPSVEEVVS